MKTIVRLLAMTIAGISSVFAQPTQPEPWEGEVAAIEAQDKNHPPEIGSALFLGDSSIGTWKTLDDSFPRVACVNHGFTGATMAGTVRLFDRLVTPLKPRIVVLSAGSGDLEAGRTPEEVARDFRAFCEKWHAFTAVQRVVFTSIPMTPARWALREKIALTNAYIAAFCAADQRRLFLDLNSVLLDPQGQPRPEMFGPDRNLLSAAGFAAWTELVAPQIDWRSTRFEKDILAFEAADRAKPPPLGGVLFTGASSIKLWTTIEQDFAGIPIINRGFGGSFTMDLVHYFNRLVPPYHPKLIVVSVGGNDLFFGHQSAEESAGYFQVFLDRVHVVQPQTKVIFLSSGHSPLRWAARGEITRFNEVMAALCAKDPLCTFVDLTTVMLTPDGQLRPELYKPDHLHLNDAGYAIWKEKLTPYVKQLYKP